MKDVEGWWEVPSICYYCSLLGNAFGLPEFTIERLEEALLSEEEDLLLVEIFTTLSQAILPDSSDQSWRENVNTIFTDRGKPNPFDKNEVEKKLSSWERLDILYNLCELRLECLDVRSIIKTIEKWQLKIVPIGEDCNEMLYWYFCETRIYRQDRTVEFVERKSARRAAKRQKSINMRNTTNRYAYENLLKLQDTPRSNLIKEDEDQEHWAVITRSSAESEAFAVQFESSTEPDEETLYRNLAKIVLPKIQVAIAEQETKAQMAGERKGLTRSGRKVVARYKNGFVNSNETSESSDTKSDSSRIEQADATNEAAKRQSKRRRTQPPAATLGVRRSSRHNSDTLLSQSLPVPSPTKKSPRGRPAGSTPRRSVGRPTRRSKTLEEFAEPPSTDTDDEVDENEVEGGEEGTTKTTEEETEEEEEEEETEEDNEEAAGDKEGEEKEQEEENTSPAKKERKKPGRKPGWKAATWAGPPTPAKKTRTPGRVTMKDMIATALAFRDKDMKGRPKPTPTGDGDKELGRRLADVMATVTRHPDAWQFNEPVNEDFAPYYYTLVDNPKDFGKIERAVLNLDYTTVPHFVDDINLVYTNCYDYNGPINEYTKAARILEKYFRRVMRELFREEYTFDTHSVIHPGKRPFVHRKNRIKALKLSGVVVTPQKNRPLDESSRDSTSSNLRSPGGDENSNDGSEASTKKRKSWSRRKKTTESDQPPVSFTAMLSDSVPGTGGPPGHHGHHQYYYGYPPHYYHPYYHSYHPPPDNTPTYIELSPRPPRKRTPCKNDEEPLLFPLMHKPPLPRPSLSADKVPEDLMLRDLATHQPSQINRISSTTTPSESSKTSSSSNQPSSSSSQAAPSSNGNAAPSSNKPAPNSNGNVALSSSQSNSSSNGNAAPSSNDETIAPSSTKAAEASQTETKAADTSTHSTASPDQPKDQETAIDSTNGTETGASLNNEAVAKKPSSEASPKHVPLPKETLPKPTLENTLPPRPVDPVVAPVAQYPPQAYTNGYYGQPNPAAAAYYNGGFPQSYHGYGVPPQSHGTPPHHAYQSHPQQVPSHPGYPSHHQPYPYTAEQHAYYQQQQQQQQQQYAHLSPHHAPSPLLGEQALFVSRSKQITSTGRSRTSRPAAKSRSSTPSRRKASPPAPIAQLLPEKEAPKADEVEVLPPSPPRDSKKKKVFDIRIQPKVKRVRS